MEYNIKVSGIVQTSASSYKEAIDIAESMIQEQSVSIGVDKVSMETPLDFLLHKRYTKISEIESEIENEMKQIVKIYKAERESDSDIDYNLLLELYIGDDRYDIDLYHILDTNNNMYITEIEYRKQ